MTFQFIKMIGVSDNDLFRTSYSNITILMFCYVMYVASPTWKMDAGFRSLYWLILVLLCKIRCCTTMKYHLTLTLSILMDFPTDIDAIR